MDYKMEEDVHRDMEFPNRSSSDPAHLRESSGPTKMSQVGTKKSRKGCKRCKQRRVKCDEQAPCSNCIRRSEECSLLEPTPSSSNSEARHDPALPSDSDEWIDDLELMHHYTSSTSDTLLGVRDDVQSLWREYIPQRALKHDFLMHGLLALAALHLAYLRPQEVLKYLQLCDKHQAVALKEFRTILSTDIDPALGDTLFALSSVTSVSSMARSCVANQARAVDMDAVCELFFLTRGVRDVLHILYDQVRHGPMARLFENAEFQEGLEIVLVPQIQVQLNGIRQMLADYGLDPGAQAHCEAALDDLEKIFLNMQYFAPTAHIETGQILRWTVSVPTGYVRLVQAANPPALVILAYFAAAWTGVRKAWYTEHFAEYTLRGIGHALDESMQHWLQWPLQQLDERLAILGVQPAQGERDSPRPLIGF